MKCEEMKISLSKSFTRKRRSYARMKGKVEGAGAQRKAFLIR